MPERHGYRDYENQKQLRQGQQSEQIADLSGDASRDDRDEAANEISVMAVQPLLGFPFMHPMHDASIDQTHAPRAFRGVGQADVDSPPGAAGLKDAGLEVGPDTPLDNDRQEP